VLGGCWWVVGVVVGVPVCACVRVLVCACMCACVRVCVPVYCLCKEGLACACLRARLPELVFPNLLSMLCVILFHSHTVSYACTLLFMYIGI